MKKLRNVLKSMFLVKEEIQTFEFEEEEELGFFEIIPDEILLEIFKFLPLEDVCQNISLACLRFARLYRLGVHTIRVTGNLRKLPEDTLIKFLLRFEKLEKLVICNNGSLEDYQITNSGLIQLAHKYIYHSADYTSGSISYTDFGTRYESLLDELSNSCFSEGTLSVYSGENDDLETRSDCKSDALSEIDDIFFKAYSETASTASNDTIKTLFSEFKHYRGVFQHDDVQDEENKGGEPVYGLNTLKYLDLTGCCLLTDFGVKYLTFLCREVEHLHLRGCDKLTDNAVNYFSEFQHLISLDLSGLTRLTDKSMKQLGMTQRKLEKLDITFCRKVTNEGLVSLSNIPTLKEVVFQCCTQLSEKGLMVLFSKCKKLEKIDLTGCSHVKLSRIPDDVKIELENLETLSLLGCIQTTDECVDTIVKQMKCKRLKKFRGAYCDKITDSGIRTITQFCRKLELINVKKCVKLTHLAIKYISKYCKRSLKKLNFTGIDFNSLAFYYIRNLEKLENLILQNCNKLGNKQLEHVPKMNSIKRIDLSFNDNISFQGIKQLCQRYYPSVNIFRFTRKKKEVVEDEGKNFLESMSLIRCPLSHKQKKDLEKYFPKISFRFTQAK